MADHINAEVESKAASSDSLARNRALALLGAASIPTRPDEFKPTPIEVRRSSLSRIAERSRAETKEALRECAQKGDSLQKELGDGAPDAKESQAILEKWESIEQGKLRVALLLEYYNEMEEIILSDAAEFLSDAGEEYEHRVKKRANLENEYPKLKRYRSEHGEAIREGRKRKKQAIEAATQKLQEKK